MDAAAIQKEVNRRFEAADGDLRLFWFHMHLDLIPLTDRNRPVYVDRLKHRMSLPAVGALGMKVLKETLNLLDPQLEAYYYVPDGYYEEFSSEEFIEENKRWRALRLPQWTCVQILGTTGKTFWVVLHQTPDFSHLPFHRVVSTRIARGIYSNTEDLPHWGRTPQKEYLERMQALQIYIGRPFETEDYPLTVNGGYLARELPIYNSQPHGLPL